MLSNSGLVYLQYISILSLEVKNTVLIYISNNKFYTNSNNLLFIITLLRHKSLKTKHDALF